MARKLPLFGPQKPLAGGSVFMTGTSLMRQWEGPQNWQFKVQNVNFIVMNEISLARKKMKPFLASVLFSTFREMTRGNVFSEGAQKGFWYYSLWTKQLWGESISKVLNFLEKNPTSYLFFTFSSLELHKVKSDENWHHLSFDHNCPFFNSKACWEKPL